MRISLSVATLVAISALMASRPAVTYGQGAPAPSGTAVAVVDISEIFKVHPTFNQQMDAMKGEVAQFEQQIQTLRTQMQNKQQDLQTYRAGTPEHQQLQREIADLASRVQVDTAMKGEEFRAREAEIYFTTYQEVVGVIARFADQHGIQLVLRYNSSDADPADPQSVLRQVNQQVVLQRNLNITYQIIGILNQQAGVPAAGGAR